MTACSRNDCEQTRRERELYRRLLELGRCEELSPLLAEALALIVELTGAKKGYLALYHEGQDEPGWSISRGCSDEELGGIRREISRGVIAETLATGRTITTESARRDPRFQERASVMSLALEAVLCTPVGAPVPLGVLYLQEPAAGGPFRDEDRWYAEVFAGHLVPFVDRLLSRERQRDPTRESRARLQVAGIIGRSAAMAELLLKLEGAARFDVAVLLTGPSGTGKTALARAIHDNSPRARRPFVELNCAAVPEALFESELFGAMPGAHSTAIKRLQGKISAAEGGTLLLDEIGELPLSVQAKLLQFLQSKSYFPLGGAAPERADVRVIAATNIDLEAALTRRAFREDLYYRLSVMPLRVPALSERREDIPLLVEHFCRETCRQHNLPRLTATQAALHAAELAGWPGNVRQLAHAVEVAAIRAAVEGAERLERRHLFPELEGAARPSQQMTFQDATRRFQRDLLAASLSETGWNIAETARQLELARSHVYRLIDAFGLRQPERDRT
jgi:Nif-specific regulatory protein